MLADFLNPTAWPEQQAEMLRCLRKTRTDPDIVLYPHAQVPCGCVQHHGAVESAQAQGRMEKCGGCDTQKPRTQLVRCADCKQVWYCIVGCQRADWECRKKLCKPIAQASQARETAL